jgi:predicted esterase
MEQHDLNFNFKARYYTLGDIGRDTNEVWFVLHGYGQLAQYFIKKFKVLESKKICVVAPEGLSKFYLHNFSPGTGRANDRVGATWMTKENRLADIENYLNYLTAVYSGIVGSRNVPATLLGFSQGSATACRWAASGRINFRRLILWSGMFPPDMDFDSGKEILKDKDVAIVYGKKDPFLNDQLFEQMKSVSAKLNHDIRTIEFDGEHDIDEATLLKLVQ